MATYNNSASASAGGQVDISVGITPGAGSDRFMLAFGHIGDNTPATGTMVIDSDLDGNLSDEYTIQVPNAYNGHKAASLVSPSTGAHTITLNRDAAYAIALHVVTFTDVDQTTPTGTWAFDTGANINIQIATAVDDIVFGAIYADDNAIEVAGDLTERTTQENYGSDGFSSGTGTADGVAGNRDADWTNVSGSYGAGGAAVNINDAGGGGALTGAGTATIPGNVVADGTSLADGTSTCSATVTAVGRSLAAATSTLIGDLVGVAVSLALGTATASADVVAAGTNLSSSVLNGAGTATISGDLVADGTSLAQGYPEIPGDVTADGAQLGFATSILSATVSADGQSLGFGTATSLVRTLVDAIGREITGIEYVYGAGQIDLSLTMDSHGRSIHAITRTGIVNLIGSLNASGDQDIMLGSGSVLANCTLAADPPEPFLESGSSLGYGRINVAPEVHSFLRKSPCTLGSGTIHMKGASMSAGYTDPNLFLKTATITIKTDVNMAALYPRQATITGAASMTAFGRGLPQGPMAMEAQRADFSVYGRIGAGTIDGQKQVVLNVPYGSVTVYNNSQGGFYTIGGAAEVKEGFAQLIAVVDMEARGERDSIKYVTASIGMQFDMSAVDAITLMSGTVNVNGSVDVTPRMETTATITGIAAVDGAGSNERFPATGTISAPVDVDGDGTMITIASGTIQASATAAAIGGTFTYSLSGATISDVDSFNSRQVYATVIVNSNGNVYSNINGVQTQLSAGTDYVRPTNGAPNLHVRFTASPLGDAPSVDPGSGWLPCTLNREYGFVIDAPEEDVEYRDANLLIELSNNAGLTVVESGTYNISARRGLPA